MDGFKRPNQRPVIPRTSANIPSQPAPRPVSAPTPQPQSRPVVQVQQAPAPAQQPIDTPVAQPTTVAPLVAPQNPPTAAPSPLKVSKRRKWPFIVGAIILVLVAIVIASVAWYKHALTPVNTGDKTVQQVQIGEGATFAFVSERLQERKLIRSSLALTIYAQLHGRQGDIKKGTCNLTPSESAVQILDRLTKGCSDFKSVTFYPGGTVFSPKGVANSKDFSVYAGLKAAGFGDEAIMKALNAAYDSPIFADKPAGTGLEGYIYGDTYYINVDGGPEQALNYAFSEMNKVIKDNDLVAKFKKQGLNLYEGIIMASIVQRELSCDGLTGDKQSACYSNQQKIAQVFYSRLDMGMTLGSDVTFIYAAGLTGEPALPSLDSPYNTRIVGGLPPGPIATPGLHALIAAANPAATDYLYFVAGDEGGGAVYYAKDEAGHQYNITNHCQVYCG